MYRESKYLTDESYHSFLDKAIEESKNIKIKMSKKQKEKFLETMKTFNLIKV